MESSEKIKVALFCAGSHLEEKTVEAESEEDYSSLIGCKKDYFLNYQSLKIGDKNYAVFYDTDKKASRWYKPDAIPSVTNDNFGPIIYGNVVISNQSEDTFTSLTKDDFENIQNHIGYLIGTDATTPFLFPAIRNSDGDINDMLKRLY